MTLHFVYLWLSRCSKGLKRKCTSNWPLVILGVFILEIRTVFAQMALARRFEPRHPLPVGHPVWVMCTEQSLKVTKVTKSNPAAPSADGTRVDYQNAAESDRMERRLQSTQLIQTRKA